MKRQGTLVIVDMQPEFPAVKLPLVRSVVRKIRLAKMLGYGIVVVEYGEENNFNNQPVTDTHWLIEKELIPYKKKAYVVKHIDDGSPQTVEAIERLGFNRRHVYVCGVNTCACVYATVGGLAKRLPAASIYIQADACKCKCGCDVRYQVTALRH